MTMWMGMPRLLAALLCVVVTLAGANADPIFRHGGHQRLGGRGGGGGSAYACDAGSSVCAQFQNGQTFITWNDPQTGAAGANTRFRVVRSNAPINSGNYGSATVIAQYVLNNSAQLFGGDPANIGLGPFTQSYRQNASVAMSVIPDVQNNTTRTPAAYTGLQVYTALGSGSAYYAVIATDTSDASDSYVGSAGPIAESIAPPTPIKFADSLSRGQSFGKIDVAVSNVPVVLQLHQSNATGACTVQSCQTGDYWEWFLTTAEGWQDGRATTLDVGLDKSLTTYRQNTLVLSSRDTWWNSLGTGGIESYHAGLGMTPNPLVGPANRHYLATANGLNRMLNWAVGYYGLDPNQLHCRGASMGAWGCANTGMRMTGPQFAAAWMSIPMWRKDLYGFTLAAGGTWSDTMPFRATVHASPKNLGDIGTPIFLSDGVTRWDGSGGYADMPGFIASNPGTDLPFADWMWSKNDLYTTVSEQLSAKAAFESAHRGYAGAWFMGAHDTTFLTRGVVDCDWSGHDDAICYGKSLFKLNTPYAAFSNSSINDDPGTGATLANGSKNGSWTGCWNCGFTWNFTSDTSGGVSFTIANNYMSRSPTVHPQTTLTGSIASSGAGTATVTDGTVFQSISTTNGNAYFMVGGTEIIEMSARSGNNLTMFLRGVLGTTAQAHSAGETVQQIMSEPTGPNGGPYSSMTADITPRRLRNFKPANGAIVTCTITPFGGSPTTQNPTVANGLFTLTGVTINATGATSVSCLG